MPNNGADLSIDAAKIAKDTDKLVRRYLTAGTVAVSTATRSLEKKLEAATQAAVPGKLWRAWQSSRFPQSGPAQNPVGTIWLKGGSRTRGAIQFWTQPGAIRGKGGQFLAIPLPAAGPRGRGRDLTPGEWERRNPGMRLQFVYRPGKPSLLVAVDAVLSGRKQIARGNTARRIAAGRASATVPIFVLLPLVKFRNAFAVEPIVAASEGEMVRGFLAAASAITQP
ncbi:DUF6441 family protein [Sphingomonas sp. PAMC 26621]|uniref:DUF6441 family protein n=1 Tax=Sphingomonas sp. PAMC 26621 TaxID=1112213 RepID=UPI0002882854|nr:DUF6441 family protein [Sphingomonas sp. PAMC 26621]